MQSTEIFNKLRRNGHRNAPNHGIDDGIVKKQATPNGSCNFAGVKEPYIICSSN